MVSVNYISNTELKTFDEKTNANSNFQIIVDTKEDIIEKCSKEDFITAAEFFDLTKTNSKIKDICKDINDLLSNYDKEKIINVIENIIDIDPNIYYDTLSVIHAMLQAKLAEERYDLAVTILESFNLINEKRELLDYENEDVEQVKLDETLNDENIE